MEKPVISHNTPPRIAIIIPYFGSLPPYFPIWLESAKANPDVDFLFYTDQDIQINAPNFRVTKTTLEALRQRFSQKLGRPVSLPYPYKLCDYKPVYGLFFEDELRGYDFWGHCDIDLVFGRIRHFLTDDVLSRYERVYAFGPLSVYRNNEKMRRAFELPGSRFSLKEMFGPVHLGADEFYGINRICLKNNILWYTEVEFAQLKDYVKSRLEIWDEQPNYPTQIFYWRDGSAFQRYVDGGEIRERELAFIHWMKKKPVPERLPNPGEAVVITAEKLLVRAPQDLTPENMSRWNPVLSEERQRLEYREFRKERNRAFWKDNFPSKKVRLKRKLFAILERLFEKRPYL